MTSSADASGRDVDRHLASHHELHSTSIPCDVGDTPVRHSTSGLAVHGTTEDMSVSDLSDQSCDQSTGCMDVDMLIADRHYPQDVTDDLVPVSTLHDDVTRSRNNDDDITATTSHHSSASFSNSAADTSSSTAHSSSYMLLRSQTNR